MPDVNTPPVVETPKVEPVVETPPVAPVVEAPKVEAVPEKKTEVVVPVPAVEDDRHPVHPDNEFGSRLKARRVRLADGEILHP